MLTELEYPIATTRSEQRGFQETKADSRRGRRQKTVSKDSYSSSPARIALQHKAELTWKRRNGVLSLDSTFPRRSSFSWQAMAANDPRGKGLPQHQMLCTGALGGEGSSMRCVIRTRFRVVQSWPNGTSTCNAPQQKINSSILHRLAAYVPQTERTVL